MERLEAQAQGLIGALPIKCHKLLLPWTSVIDLRMTFSAVMYRRSEMSYVKLVDLNGYPGVYAFFCQSLAH